MSLLVAFINPNGTVSLITPVLKPNDNELEIAKTIQAQNPGSEIISSDLVTALKRSDTPINNIPNKEFKKRLLPLKLILAGKPAGTQTKWDRIFNVLESFEIINKSDADIQSIMQQMISDGIATQVQIDNLLRIV